MEKLNNNFLGLVLGIFLSIVHAVWALLVALDLAQPLINWFHSLHFVKPVYTLAAFSFGKGLTLVIATFIGGYLFGWVFAWVWNLVKGAKK